VERHRFAPPTPISNREIFPVPLVDEHLNEGGASPISVYGSIEALVPFLMLFHDHLCL